MTTQHKIEIGCYKAIVSLLRVNDIISRRASASSARAKEDFMKVEIPEVCAAIIGGWCWRRSELLVVQLKVAVHFEIAVIALSTSGNMQVPGSGNSFCHRP
jgi:hypothetical protein